MYKQTTKLTRQLNLLLGMFIYDNPPITWVVSKFADNI